MIEINGTYVTVTEAMDILGVTLCTIRRYIKNGKLKVAFREGANRKIYFNIAEVFSVKDRRKNKNGINT